MVDYCAVSDVKPVLKIDAAETSEDTELAECVSNSSNKVKNLLLAKDLEVPAEIPDSIKIATQYFAAWQYRRRRDPEGAQAFWYDAQETLNEYIAAAKSKEDEPIVGMV